tara:strand:+ start:37683 stop:38681 length:999 start_codon:yes stop_codon:yes gene_type:complete
MKKPLLITEISGNHNGNKKLFLEHIREAAVNGADIIKIQTYEPKDITLKVFDERFRIKKGTWKNQYLWNLYKKAHTPFSWHKEAFDLAKKLKVQIFSSPFSKRAVDLLENLNVKMYKIASFEITDLELIDYIAKKKKLIVLSTGMANLNEIKRAIKCINKYHNKIIILYCVSGYPSKEKDINLDTLNLFKKEFKNYQIGLSDHTNDVYTSLAATTFGISLIEKHFIISKKISSPDLTFSIDKQQLKFLKNGINKIFISIGKGSIGIKKIERDSMMFRRSIFAIKNIKKGEKFTEENIGCFRPKKGLGAENFTQVLGKKSKKFYKKNSSIYSF